MRSEEERSQRWSIAFGLYHWIVVVGLLKLSTKMRKEGVQLGGENTEISWSLSRLRCIYYIQLGCKIKVEQSVG